MFDEQRSGSGDGCCQFSVGGRPLPQEHQRLDDLLLHVEGRQQDFLALQYGLGDERGGGGGRAVPAPVDGLRTTQNIERIAGEDLGILSAAEPDHVRAHEPSRLVPPYQGRRPHGTCADANDVARLEPVAPQPVGEVGRDALVAAVTHLPDPQVPGKDDRHLTMRNQVLRRQQCMRRAGLDVTQICEDGFAAGRLTHPVGLEYGPQVGGALVQVPAY
ncbi:hypothetical protein [Streptomyces sp. NPDC017890]|uniref:hypothetical protein n=1 Tax=Streptomyces sp. NPDC017890 TaxID=3365015 RepID=UPI0037A4F021